jgi:trigger factor
MKVKVLQIAPCQKLLKIEIPKETVDQELSKIYEDIRKVAEIPGFRKGKAPRKIIEQHHSKTAKDEVLKKLIPSGYSKAIKENSINPASMPDISQVKLVDNEPLYFEAKVDVEPEVNLRKYKGLKIKKRTPKVESKEIKQALEVLRDRFAEYKPVEGREIKEDDYVIADFETKVEGKTVDKKENSWFYIKKDNKVESDEVIKALRGTKIDTEVRVDTTLPEDYFKKEYINKPATIEVKVKEIREKKLPKLDKEFLKNIGDYKSQEELEEAVSVDIKKRKEQEIGFEVESQLSDSLVKFNPIQAPASMIKRQTDELVNSAKMRLRHQGLKDEDIKSRDEDLRKNMEKEAEKQVKLYFILNAIAKEENITVNDKDVEERLKRLAKQNKTEPDKIREYLTKNNSLESLRNQIEHEKTIDFLTSQAKIKEVNEV